jgi:hypothetical protein
MTDAEANAAEPSDEERPDHLSDVPDGCGCAEVWEHLSERRRSETERGE